MSIKNSYDGMDWVDALKGRKDKRDYQARYANTPEEETLEDALEQTAEAVFNVPTKEETSSEAISRMSKDIHDKSATKKSNKEIEGIKAKLAATDDRPAIDPVELGVKVKSWGAHGMSEKPITKEQWDKISDPRVCEEIAKVAAIEFKKQNRLAEWQTSQNKQHSQSFDPQTDRSGKIASSHGHDDYAPRFGSVPANANSILDPGRLDRAAKEINEHDANVAKSKTEHGQRSKKAEAERAVQEKEESPIAVNHGSKIMHSGGHDSEAFSHKVPRNQISMADNLGDDFDSLDSEAKKARLESVFMAKFDDNGPEIKKAAEERKSSIQRKKTSKEAQKKEWDELKKPVSTSEIQRRLVELWMPEEPEK